MVSYLYMDCISISVIPFSIPLQVMENTSFGILHLSFKYFIQNLKIPSKYLQISSSKLPTPKFGNL